MLKGTPCKTYISSCLLITTPQLKKSKYPLRELRNVHCGFFAWWDTPVELKGKCTFSCVSMDEYHSYQFRKGHV